MKKKDYEKPTTQVVQLQNQSTLLQSSPAPVRAQDYGWHYESEE